MTAVTRFDLETMLIDTRYALKQCGEIREGERAADALGRVEERLAALLASAIADDEADGPTPHYSDGGSYEEYLHRVGRAK